MKKYFIHSALVLATLGLAACDSDKDDDDHTTTWEYEITLVNATANQPLSPLSLVIHDSATTLWMLGEEASTSIEMIAEGGDNTALLDTYSDQTVLSGEGLIMPGSSETLMMSYTGTELPGYFSAITMPVNTNDAFAGVSALDISELELDASVSITLPIYDAGTEYNAETMATIPGPAAGGEGYNSERNDIMNKISRHSGLVTQADDMSSVLLPEHKIDGVAGILTITRIN